MGLDNNLGGRGTELPPCPLLANGKSADEILFLTASGTIATIILACENH
jgi:hypothetical protein